MYFSWQKKSPNGCITNCSSRRPLLIIASHINCKSRTASRILIDVITPSPHIPGHDRDVNTTSFSLRTIWLLMTGMSTWVYYPAHMIAVHSSKRLENPTYRPLVPLVLDCLHTFGYAKAMLIVFTGAGAVVVPLWRTGVKRGQAGRWPKTIQGLVTSMKKDGWAHRTLCPP